MQLLKPLRFISPFIKTILFGISFTCTYTNFIHSNEASFIDCFSKDYTFQCENPLEFLKKMGVDINQNIIHIQDLHQTDKTTWGCHKGSFHADTKGVEYFVKSTQMMNELIGSRLLNIILDTERTPVVNLVDGKENGIASQKLPKFVRRNNIKRKNKKIMHETELSIALDYTGIRNRGGKNMGYIMSGKDLIAARVDVDKSFAFGNNRWKAKNLNSDHLNLSLLNISLKKYPKDQLISAIKRVTGISDEKIMMTIFECWATLNQVGYPIPLDVGFVFGKQLIERKEAFSTALEKIIENDLSSETSKIIDNQDKKKIKSKKKNIKNKQKTKTK